MPDRCSNIDRLAVHPSIVIGGFGGMGHCTNECLPGFTVCFDHVTKEALWMRLQQFLKKKRGSRAY